MRNVQTKLTNSEYEKLKEIASRKGITIYQLLREIIQEYLAKESDDVSDLPIEVRLRKLELQHQKTREELEEIARKYEQLKKQLEELLEKANKQGISAWLQPKRR